VASATSYVAARLALLSDVTAYAGRNGATIDAAPLLRRALETDRFGFLAHVLAVRDGCASENCKALALLHNPSQVRTNLSEATFNRFLESYLPIWAKASEPAVAEAPQVQAAAPAAPANASGPRKIVNIDFPTAASIPAVNIMNPEPTGPVLPGAAAAAAANPNAQSAAPASSRRSHKPAANPPAPAAVQPAAPGQQAAVEPIWPEPLPPRPAVGPATAAPPPAQVNPVPFAPAPDANAAAAARGQ
jgi:hypothetical protein